MPHPRLSRFLKRAIPGNRDSRHKQSLSETDVNVHKSGHTLRTKHASDECVYAAAPVTKLQIIQEFRGRFYDGIDSEYVVRSPQSLHNLQRAITTRRFRSKNPTSSVDESLSFDSIGAASQPDTTEHTFTSDQQNHNSQILQQDTLQQYFVKDRLQELDPKQFDFSRHMIVARCGMAQIVEVEAHTPSEEEPAPYVVVKWRWDHNCKHDRTYHAVIIPKAQGTVLFEQMRPRRKSIQFHTDIQAPWAVESKYGLGKLVVPAPNQPEMEVDASYRLNRRSRSQSIGSRPCTAASDVTAEEIEDAQAVPARDLHGGRPIDRAPWIVAMQSSAETSPGGTDTPPPTPQYPSNPTEMKLKSAPRMTDPTQQDGSYYMSANLGTGVNSKSIQ